MTIEEQIKRLEKNILQKVNSAKIRATKESAAFATTSIKHRIFNLGKGVSGDPHGGTGLYSKKYAAYRVAKGLQTKYMDYKFTGKLHASVQRKPVSKFAQSVVILGSRNIEIAEELDLKKGLAFAFTKSEKKEVLNVFLATFKRELNK